MMKCFTLFILLCSMNVFAQSFHAINSNNVEHYVNAQSQVLQVGNHNRVEAALFNNSMNIIQLGKENQFNYLATGMQNNTLTVSMQGSANRVEVVGNNSISNGMQIEIIGNRKQIYVNNK